MVTIERKATALLIRIEHDRPDCTDKQLTFLDLRGARLDETR